MPTPEILTSLGRNAILFGLIAGSIILFYWLSDWRHYRHTSIFTKIKECILNPQGDLSIILDCVLALLCAIIINIPILLIIRIHWALALALSLIVYAICCHYALLHSDNRFYSSFVANVGIYVVMEFLLHSLPFPYGSVAGLAACAILIMIVHGRRVHLQRAKLNDNLESWGFRMDDTGELHCMFIIEIPENDSDAEFDGPFIIESHNTDQLPHPRDIN